MAEELAIDWDHVYLLGWYDEAGKSYLSSWKGDRPMIHVVVIGCGPTEMPLWAAPLRSASARLEPIPPEITDHKARIAYATERGGVYAIGWHTPEKIHRAAPKSPWS